MPSKLTQTQLAERLGVDYNTIRRYREGKAKKTLESWSAKRDPDGISWKYLPHESRDLENFYAPAEEGEQDQSESAGNLNPQVDLEEVRDRVLKNLSLGTQASGYKIARKVLDRFINEVKGDG